MTQKFFRQKPSSCKQIFPVVEKHLNEHLHDPNLADGQRDIVQNHMEQSKVNSKYLSNSEGSPQYNIENMILSIKNNEQFSEVAKEFRHEIIVAMENLLMSKWQSLNTPTSSVYKNFCDKVTLVDNEKYLPAFTLSETKFSLTWDSKSSITQLLENNPVTPREKLELYPPADGISRVDVEIRKERYKGTTGRLMGTVPQIPPPSSIQKNLHWTKEKYTSEENVVDDCREQIIHFINSNPITIISGPPGIGKTTYLPQILVDECYMQGHRCRIICSQPYRLYAHINADRLSQIRGETTGQTVGYQIRLESKVSPKTLLTFCTHGVLLRTICADPRIMAGTTHIIVDEIEDDEIPENLHLTKLQNTEAKLMMTTVSNGDTDKSWCADNPDVGYGILLAIIPSLLNQYQHLKVILIINSRISTYEFCHENILNEMKNSINSVNAPSSVPMTYCEVHNNAAQYKYEISSINFKGQIQQPKFNLINNGFDELSSVSSHSTDNNLSPAFTAKVTPPIANIRNNISSENVVYKPLQGFSKYYNGAPIISIPYRAKQVRVYYLEDILEWTNYSTSRMNEASVCMSQDDVRCRNMYFWLTTKESDKYISCEYHIYTTDSGNKVNMVKDKTFNTSVSNAVPKKLPVFPEGQAVPHLKSDQILNQTDDCSEVCSTVFAKKHANNLLWSIWLRTVLDPNRNKLNKHHMKETDEMEVTEGKNSCLTNLLQCILSGLISVDYEHSDSGLTSIMVCSAGGLLEAVKCLLRHGADPFMRVAIPYEPLIGLARKQCKDFKLFGPKDRKMSTTDENYTIVGVTAYDLACIFDNNEIANLLKTYMINSSLRHEPENWEAILLRFGSWFQSPIGRSQFDNCTFKGYQPFTTDLGSLEETKVLMNSLNFRYKLLSSYQLARNNMEPETIVDHDLLTALIVKIDSSLPRGVILIFLPSYEEIMTLRGRLIDPDNSPWKSPEKPLIFILHPRMLVADLKTIYAQSSRSHRKLILSSSIAESSMTFDDVVYIIDCGLNYGEEFLDWTQTTSLRNQWISKSNAIQRKSRVGKNINGICFRLYSSLRYSFLPEERRGSLSGHVIEEMCIQARLLAPSNITLQTVLSALPKPPSPKSCENAIETLKEMDVLDTFEELTELGYHICDMPIPPRYAKMVLFSVVLKCLDPILTIACILTYTEPFILPRNAAERKDLMNIRRSLSSNSYSDHMVLLRAFQFWQKSRSEGWEKAFCQKHFISSATFEVIIAIRTQLLGQLRASGFVKTKGSGDIRDLNSNSDNWAVVKAAIVAGMYGNLAQVDRNNSCLRIVNGNSMPVVLDPQSVIATNANGAEMNVNDLPCDWLVFNEVLTLTDPKLHTSPESNNTDHLALKKLKIIRCVSIVSPITVALMGGSIRVCPQIEKETHSIANENNMTATSILENNGQLLSSYIQQNIHKTLPTMMQQKTIKQNPYSMLSDSDTTRISSFKISELNDSALKMLKYFNSMQISDCFDHVKSLSLQNQTKLSQPSVEQPNMESSSSTNVQKNNIVSFHLDPHKFLRFTVNSNEAIMVTELRQKWHALLLRRLKNPGKHCSQQDEAVLKCLINVLTNEEKALGLLQPFGVGARPRPMAVELYNRVDDAQNIDPKGMKAISEQPVSNRYGSIVCTTAGTNTTMPIFLSNTSLVKQNNSMYNYSSITNPKLTEVLSTNDFNKPHEQYLFQVYKGDNNTSMYNPIKQINISSTEIWKCPLPSNTTGNTDSMSVYEPFKDNISLSEGKNTSTISHMTKGFSEKHINIQNFKPDSLPNLKQLGIVENKKHQSSEHEILGSKTRHYSTTSEDKNSSDTLYGPHALNTVTNPFDVTYPTANHNNITMENDVAFRDINDIIYALLNDDTNKNHN
uniref:Putative atp-dependent RNA helicase n=1 Tax=Schistosoma mansoni TaxID=6183 RepID=A0A5K4EVU8_SCHMA